jgi:hypothetical protein
MRQNQIQAFTATLLTLFLASCGNPADPSTASPISLSAAESVYGRLITTGNHSTPDQHGTGQRIGLFQDSAGTVWGLPLSISAGEIQVCAPAALRNARITDFVPAGESIVGATNEPTGWRGGTGKLELMLRDGSHVHSLGVSGAKLESGPVCWASVPPGPRQQLEYYRLAPKSRPSQS